MRPTTAGVARLLSHAVGVVVHGPSKPEVKASLPLPLPHLPGHGLASSSAGLGPGPSGHAPWVFPKAWPPPIRATVSVSFICCARETSPSASSVVGSDGTRWNQSAAHQRWRPACSGVPARRTHGGRATGCACNGQCSTRPECAWPACVRGGVRRCWQPTAVAVCGRRPCGRRRRAAARAARSGTRSHHAPKRRPHVGRGELGVGVAVWALGVHIDEAENLLAERCGALRAACTPLLSAGTQHTLAHRTRRDARRAGRGGAHTRRPPRPRTSPSTGHGASASCSGVPPAAPSGNEASPSSSSIRPPQKPSVGPPIDSMAAVPARTKRSPQDRPAPYFILIGASSVRALSRLVLSAHDRSGSKRWRPPSAPPRPSHERSATRTTGARQRRGDSMQRGQGWGCEDWGVNAQGLAARSPHPARAAVHEPALCHDRRMKKGP